MLYTSSDSSFLISAPKLLMHVQFSFSLSVRPSLVTADQSIFIIITPAVHLSDRSGTRSSLATIIDEIAMYNI